MKGRQPDEQTHVIDETTNRTKGTDGAKEQIGANRETEGDNERETTRDTSDQEKRERDRERQSNIVENLCKVASTSNALAKADALGLPPPW